MKEYNGWRQMADITKEEFLDIEQADKAWESQLADRLIQHLKTLDERGGNDAIPVSRLEHGLQCGDSGTPGRSRFRVRGLRAPARHR